MKTTRSTAATVLALSILVGVPAWAGDFHPILDADIIDNQMIGLAPTGRPLTAEELEFHPILDSDIIDNQMIGLAPTGRPLTAEELEFDPILDADIIEPALEWSAR